MEVCKAVRFTGDQSCFFLHHIQFKTYLYRMCSVFIHSKYLLVTKMHYINQKLLDQINPSPSQTGVPLSTPQILFIPQVTTPFLPASYSSLHGYLLLACLYLI